MNRIEAEALPGEVVTSPDALALGKHITRKAWPYATVLIAVLVVLGIVFRHSLAWGDVATWVLAITSLLAFLAAAFAGIVAYDLLKVETVRDSHAADERTIAANERRRLESERAAQRDTDRRAQAAKVTTWFAQLFVGPNEKTDAEVPIWGARICNASEQPVFDVRVFFYGVNDPRDDSAWTTEMRDASIEGFRVIPPGHTRKLQLPWDIRDRVRECDEDSYLVGIEFTDASGVRWNRDDHGVLREGALVLD